MSLTSGIQIITPGKASFFFSEYSQHVLLICGVFNRNALDSIDCEKGHGGKKINSV